ncbi:glycosyltransferase [Candidatus Micrarchaeota archaeon]|nr:glycosyltransferase [Candidatus Micrarchaeota archaeon]
MKIGIFTDTFTQPNGVAKHVQGIAEHLSERHDVTVYTGSGSSDSYKVVNLPHKRFIFQPEYEQIKAVGVTPDCDVSHAHSPYCTAKLAFKTKAVVTTTHTIPQHMLSYLHADVLTPFAWRYLIRFHNRSDHVVCQTKSTERLFIERGVTKPTSVISTGLNVDKFKNGNAKAFREKYGIDGEFVLSASRLSAEKRPHWIFKACDELGIPCVATSSGPMKHYLEKKYPSVRFTGALPNGEICDSYAAASMFALTSAVETEGIVVNEAMAARVPVVATALEPVRDSVRDGENGFTFSSYGEFRQKMKMLWESTSLRDKFTSVAFKEVQEKDYSNVAGRLLSIYESLV